MTNGRTSLTLANLPVSNALVGFCKVSSDHAGLPPVHRPIPVGACSGQNTQEHRTNLKHNSPTAG
jgi:hypothetical protein